ncbi:thermonuclease family protein [uncultured Roseobacter sp.]|uniref:thermonuclease family protein n=1 Tax=uncultured Roseobacter sp. TaxID=114847 RepID=UPI00262C12BF|nr:thermonuclease family protein [uncultured Roseobacter sp.]
MKSRLKPLATLACFAISSPLFAEEPVPDCGLYTYRATIVRVIDGDTIVADIDLGFRTWLHGEHLRLFGINTPENKTDEGKAVTEAVRARIEGKSVFLCTIKAKRSEAESTGSFGRYLVTIHEGGENVNEWLLATGQAEAFMD